MKRLMRERIWSHLTELSFFICLISFNLNATAQEGEDIFNITTPSRVSVHDPSVVIGYSKNGRITGEKSDGATKVYYIFGSHKAWARSNDLQNWKTFSNNLSTDFGTIFAEDAEWSAKGGAQGGSIYDVSGNLWAPDVIWNPTMNKWCMYMSVNGDNWYSSIVLLTADDLNGSWTRVGPVVYSGFMNKTEAQATDFYKVHQGTDFPQRYTQSRNGVHTYGTNAIDPCTFFDEEGNMWMTYGSWFGGLYMIRLDKNTGLRDYTYTYTTTDGTATGATSDEYQGLKLAGGNHCSGEASYIEYINGRYYLFVTYGGLTAAGGYNMRVFSSTDVKGPYKDLYGHSAIWSNSNTNAGNTNKDVGSRLMSYYKWDLLSNGYCAQGHNSTVVDDDGKAFLVYHTRFNTGNEWHEVRVHQLFTNEDGGLVTAPFEYRGETLATEPHQTDEIVGTWNIIYHQGTDYANLVCQKEKQITLTADGKVTGAYSGTWSQSKNGPYLTLNLSGQKRKGILIRQKLEGLNYDNLCFSVIGSNDLPMWGYKNVDKIINEAISDYKQLPYSEEKVLAEYSNWSVFNTASPNTEITEETGLSLSFFISGLSSDWDEVGRSSDGKFTLYLSVLRYMGADFYEAAATVDPNSPVKNELYKAFLNGKYYATVSYNPDGTISYYRNGKLLFTYASTLSPNYGSNVTPADITKAVIDYYKNGEFDFTRSVFNVIVSTAVNYANSTSIDELIIPNSPVLIRESIYNIMGQRVDQNYKGIIIINGKKYLKK